MHPVTEQAFHDELEKIAISDEWIRARINSAAEKGTDPAKFRKFYQNQSDKEWDFKSKARDLEFEQRMKDLRNRRYDSGPTKVPEAEKLRARAAKRGVAYEAATSAAGDNAANHYGNRAEQAARKAGKLRLALVGGLGLAAGGLALRNHLKSKEQGKRKTAGTWDRQRDWAEQDRAAGRGAGKAEGAFKKAVKGAGRKALEGFGRMGPVGQAAVVSGAFGGAIGGAKGMMRNDPVYTQDGGARYPHIGDRLVRTGTGALAGGLSSAAVGGGSVYLLRKALHG